MNAVVACGGTGGHLFPGLAVAEVLRGHGHDVMIFISEKEIDALAASKHNDFRLEKLPSIGLPSPFSPAILRFVRRFNESLNLCRVIYRKFNPHLVLGMGGFTSTAPHDGRAHARGAKFHSRVERCSGACHRMTARMVRAVLLGFKECAQFFPTVRTEVTGTPIRDDLKRTERKTALRQLGLREDLKTLVMGGSQGATGVNQAVIKSMAAFRDLPLQVIHLAGARDETLVDDNYRRENIQAFVAAFHHEMATVYSAADFAIARAGAASLAELAAFSLPAILIPYPFAADNHQARNAEIFARGDAAIVLKESELSGDVLARKVRELVGDSNKLRQMSDNSSRLAPKDAAALVVKAMENILNPIMTRALEADLQKLLTQERHRVHLVGVAGSGMSGIAALLLELGHEVSGSDKLKTLETDRLQRLGLRFHREHRAEDANPAELIIYSSAIKEDNPVLASARKKGQLLVRRAEALAAIMRGKKGILVVGMHGKTTTSAMVAHVLRESGVHPSHYVGAEIPILGTNAHWDPQGEFFVAEGDESDGTVRFFHPEHTLLLNIEEEHLDFYDDLAAIESVFAQLLEQTRGKIFYSVDDANATRLCATRSNAISFGFLEDAIYRGTDIELKDFASVFCVYREGKQLGEAILSVPGQHNVSNALGVVAVAMELGVPFEKIKRSLARFEHARRRFEIKYESERFLLVDDYGHHPTEIRATLQTARAIGRKRVLTMFQPHRYSRTKALRRQFGSAFRDAEHVVVTDVYGSNEAPVAGVTGQLIADEIAAQGHRGVTYQPRLELVHSDVGNMLDPGDLILSLGAGNIHEQLSLLAADLVIAENLKEIVGEEGDVRLYEPLAKRTTLRVGGPAQFWVEPRNEKAFAELIRFCRCENLLLFVIGRGSNLLVRDGGIRGVVVHPSGGDFDKIEIQGNEITAGVGVKLKEVAYAAKAAGLGGLEWMEGIPGEVGGGLRMNAGAMGSQTFDRVVRVRYLDGKGVPHEKSARQLEVHYRHVPSLEKNYAVSAVFRGEPASAEEITRRLDQSQQKRRTTQPVAKSAGCIFKNPEICPAGKLVDELGLKNTTVGKARVSKVHGNFIVNDGGASAADILELISKIQETAREKRGIELQTEVQIVGELI